MGRLAGLFSGQQRDGGCASRPETAQSSLAALTTWADGLTTVYLEGALARALGLLEQPPLLGKLAAAEYEALEDAERLETAAAVDRADAERIRRERLATEGALAATEETAARIDAELHQEAAANARAVAADAGRRRRSALGEAHPQNARSKRSKKKR